MTFHAQFTYEPRDREKLLRFLHQGGLDTDGHVKIASGWLAVQTGTGFAILETEDAGALYELCSVWSEYGAVSITPVVPIRQV